MSREQAEKKFGDQFNQPRDRDHSKTTSKKETVIQYSAMFKPEKDNQNQTEKDNKDNQVKMPPPKKRRQDTPFWEKIATGQIGADRENKLDKARKEEAIAQYEATLNKSQEKEKQEKKLGKILKTRQPHYRTFWRSQKRDDVVASEELIKSSHNDLPPS